MARIRSKRTMGTQSYPVAAGASLTGGRIGMLVGGYLTEAAADAGQQGCVGMIVRDVDTPGGAAGAEVLGVKMGLRHAGGQRAPRGPHSQRPVRDSR